MAKYILYLLMTTSVLVAQAPPLGQAAEKRGSLPGFVSIAEFGAKGDGRTDDTAAFNAAVDAALPTAATIYFPAGKYRFASRPRVMGSGIRLVGSGSVGSKSGYGSYLIADYVESNDELGFLTWDGSYSHNSGTGGGLQSIVVSRAAGRKGGTAIKLTGSDDDHRAGFFTISNVLVTADQPSATWAHNLIVDGRCCTTKSAQGIRDVYISNFWTALATAPGESIVLRNAVQLFWHGGEVFPAGGGKDTGITISGYGSPTSNSTNIFLTDVYVAGTVTIEKSHTVSFNGYAGANLSIAQSASNVSVSGIVDGAILNQSSSSSFATNQIKSVVADGGKGMIFAGDHPVGMSGGDVGASRTNDTGVYWFGSDGKGFIERKKNGTLELSLPLSTLSSDTAGQVTLTNGTARHMFQTAFSNSPICVANDTSGPDAVQVNATTTEVLFRGTGSHSINYICLGK